MDRGFALGHKRYPVQTVKHPAKYGTGYDESEARAEYIRKRVMDEVETRDWHWLYTGEPPEVTYETEALKQDTLKNRPQEARTAERLRHVGIRCHFTKDGEKAGKDAKGRQLRNRTADLPNGIELKTVMTSRNAHGAVKNYFDKSIGKKGMRRLIIDNGESKYLSDGQIIEAVLELIDDEDVYRREFPWVSVFGKNGKLVDVVRQERSPGDPVVDRGGFLLIIAQRRRAVTEHRVISELYAQIGAELIETEFALGHKRYPVQTAPRAMGGNEGVQLPY